MHPTGSPCNRSTTTSRVSAREQVEAVLAGAAGLDNELAGHELLLSAVLPRGF